MSGHASPFLVELRVGEDLCCNPGSIDGRVGIQRPNEDLQLRLHCLLLLGSRAKDSQSATPLTWRGEESGQLAYLIDNESSAFTNLLIPSQRHLCIYFFNSERYYCICSPFEAITAITRAVCRNFAKEGKLGVFKKEGGAAASSVRGGALEDNV